MRCVDFTSVLKLMPPKLRICVLETKAWNYTDINVNAQSNRQRAGPKL